MASRASAAVAGWQAATTPPASIRNRIQPMPSCAADAALAQHPLRSKDGAGAHVPALFLRLPTGGRREGRYSRAEDFSCRSEEHTSELQSLMRISYAVFCLKKKNKIQTQRNHNTNNLIHSLYY